VQWHRALFARFLVERSLLRDEAGVVISLSDCREEAAMGSAGDEWSIAGAHAARLLPGVFPPDDPVEWLTLAPEHAKALRDHLRGLDAAISQADDSLGWTYQFWRAAEKKAVNDSQVKIGAAELPAVTQLSPSPTWCASFCTTRSAPGGPARCWRTDPGWRGRQRTRRRCARRAHCRDTNGIISVLFERTMSGARRRVVSRAGQSVPRNSRCSTHAAAAAIS
jgi:hypothetical protein